MRTKTDSLPVKVYGKGIQAILGTSSTISAVAKRYVPDSHLRRAEAIPLQVGSGEYIFSLGNADILLQFGQKVFQINAVVVDTCAFEAVLGTDFTESEHFGGLLTRTSRVLINGEEFPLLDCVETKPEIKRIFRMFKTESYSLVKSFPQETLRHLEVLPHQICVDLFANHLNHQEPQYLTKGNSAFRYNWTKLLRSSDDFLWANPPFSQLSKVVTKFCLEPTRCVLVHPEWIDQYWSPLLKDITVARVEIASGTPLFVSDHSKKPLPSPLRNTHVSLVNTEKLSVPTEKPNPKIVKWLQRTSRNWSFEYMQSQMRLYPKFDLTTVDHEVQAETCLPIPNLVSVPVDHPQTSERPCKNSVCQPHQEDRLTEVKTGITVDERISEWLENVDTTLVSHEFSDSDLCFFQADLT